MDEALHQEQQPLTAHCPCALSLSSRIHQSLRSNTCEVCRCQGVRTVSDGRRMGTAKQASEGRRQEVEISTEERIVSGSGECLCRMDNSRHTTPS